VYTGYAEDRVYADGPRGSAKVDLSRGAMPRVSLGVAYADDQMWLHRGFPAVSIRAIPVVTLLRMQMVCFKQDKKLAIL
jgi:hypothetical protein